MKVERKADPISLLCVSFMHFKQAELNNVIMDTILIYRKTKRKYYKMYGLPVILLTLVTQTTAHLEECRLLGCGAV
jgi:hypothetical protein